MSNVVYKQERRVPFPRIYMTQISSDTILLCSLPSLGQVGINAKSEESQCERNSVVLHLFLPPIQYLFSRMCNCIKTENKVKKASSIKSSIISDQI